MQNLFNRFLTEESGQDMIEYVLILAFVCLGAAAIITTLGDDMSKVWTQTSTYVSKAGSQATSAGS